MATESTTSTGASDDTKTSTGTAAGQSGDQGAGGEDLGESGVKALEAWKTRAKTAEAEARRAKALEAEVAELRTKTMSDTDRERKKAFDEGAATARAEFEGELRRERLQRAAVGKLADPADALAFLDVNDLGKTPDAKDYDRAIARLLEDKPHLAAPTSSGGSGGVTKVAQGARGGGQQAAPSMNDIIRGAVGRSA